jgi:hypothetical protein
VTDNQRTKLPKYAEWALLILALAYFIQFARALLFKGEDRKSNAFENIAYETFQRQYDGIPQMQVSGAEIGPKGPACSLWDFEWTWGNCAMIVLYIRDYRPEQQPTVEREMKRLAEQLRKPCVLLPTLRLPGEQQIARDMECSDFAKSLKLHFRAFAVTVHQEQGPPGKPHRWWAKNREMLNDYYF